MTAEVIKVHHDSNCTNHDTDRPWQPAYTEVLNHGHIGLVDFMGSDSTIVNAARVSYGGGTRATRSDRGLIRYLMRHRHTTPFEMPDFIFHVKAPIFVFRQWHRHRTASINEMSGRYSILNDEMYVPHHTQVAAQASNNKQGREASTLTPEDYNAVKTALDHLYTEAYQTYLYLNGPTEEGGQPNPPHEINNRRLTIEKAALESIEKLRAQQMNMPDDEKVEIDEAFVESVIRDWFTQSETWVVTQDYPGIARELARMVLPVATYSEMYWKCNLKNIMNFISLRSDPHAQYEIRVYSDAMLELIRPYVPMAIEAFEDYWMHGADVSRMELKLLKAGHAGDVDFTNPEAIKEFLITEGCSDRECGEFLTRLSG